MNPRFTHQCWITVMIAAGLVMPVARLAAGQSDRPKPVATVEGISEYHLPNGLRVLLFPDQSKPTVTVNVTYFVGSRHEGLGESGMAHLLEHLVFKGTPSYENIWGALEDHGADFNGSTWVDRTNYFETLPASDENLEFALKMEADRMVNSFIKQSDLDSEMTVVRNEFEMGENNPMSILSQRMTAVAYEWHNYGKSTIGPKSDIERVPIANLKSFYTRFYQPDNAMLVVAGKFDPDKALDLINKYFAPLRKPDRRLPDTYTIEPVQDGERHVTLRRNGDVGAVGAAYHISSGSHEDYAAIDALVNVLVYEPSGRLYKALVESGMASNVRGYANGFAQPGLVEFMAEVRADQDRAAVLAKMTEVLEGFAQNPVTQAEAERAKTHLLKNIDLALTRSDRIGVELSEWAAMGDWRLFFIHRDRLKTLTASDIQRVATQYLVRSNRTTGEFIPTKEPMRATIPDSPDVLALVRDYRGSEQIAAGEDFQATPENIESRTKRYELPGGIKLALLPKETRGDAVRATLTLHFGTEADLTGKTTAVAMIPDMLMRGTSKRSYQDIQDELDRLKARINFRGSGLFGDAPGSVTATIETTRDNLIPVIELLGEILKDPAFAPEELEVVKREQLAALEQQLSDPQSLAFQEMLRRLSPLDSENVRYVPTVAESIQRLGGVTLEELKASYRQFYGASHAQMAVVGDFDEAQVKAAVQRTLGDWKSPGSFQRVVIPYRGDVTASQETVHTPDKKMSTVTTGVNIPMRDDDPDYPALYIANYVLGSSAKSRLLNRLRHKGGLSYGAGSVMMAEELDRSGFIMGYAICATENTDKAYDAMLEEIDLWLAKGITEEELAEAKNSYSLQLRNRLANDAYVAAELAQGLYVGRTMAYLADLDAKIQGLTVEQVNRMIPKYVSAKRLVTVKAGDIPGK